MGIHNRIGIDCGNTFCGGVDFIFTHCVVSGNNLPIDIGHRYNVVVNEIKGTDTAASQCFYRIATDSAGEKPRARGEAILGASMRR